MGKPSRDKGRKGQREAKELLADRDYEILADTSSGLSTDDLVVKCPLGKIYSVEVKNTKSINIAAFRKQAITNAKRNPWILVCKIDQTSSWLVLQKGARPVVWHEKQL